MYFSEKQINDVAVQYNVPQNASVHEFSSVSKYGYGDIIKPGYVDVVMTTERDKDGNLIENYLCFRF